MSRTRLVATAGPSALAAAAVAAVYLLAALVIRPARDVPGCPTAGLQRLAHWDGGWYQSIARVGYVRHPGVQQPTAFYPLFPLLARAVHTVLPFLTITAAGIAINAAATVAAMVVVDRIVADWPQWQRVGCVVLLMALPGAYFVVAFYSEALFLLAVAVMLWGLIRERWWIAAGATAAASLDRTIGIVLIVPIAVVAFRRLDRRRWLAVVGVACSAIGAFAVYIVVAGKVKLFRDARAGWRGAGGLSYPAFLVRHGAAKTATLVANAGRFRRVSPTPYIGDSAVWGIGLYADAVTVVAVAAVARLARWASALIWPAIVLALATLVVGPAISQARFVAVLIPLWLGILGGVRRHRAAWLVAAPLVAAGLGLNVALFAQFASCRWAG